MEMSALHLYVDSHVMRTTALPLLSAPYGRFFGSVRLPFALGSVQAPIVRDGVLYGVVRDALDVPYVVRARVVK